MSQAASLAPPDMDTQPEILSAIDEYIESHEVKKLHVGCGPNTFKGWLNVDYLPDFPGALHLDATKPFPMPGDTFDYIYSEHMIEHISYHDGLYMLRECYRVLKPGGYIRICAPDLAFLIALYNKDKTDLQQRYITWVLNQEDDTPFHKEIFVINNFFRKWGHTFIYDEFTLRSSMKEAGFQNIISRELQQSEHDHLRNLANDKRMPEGFLALESMTFEATKAET